MTAILCKDIIATAAKNNVSKEDASHSIVLNYSLGVARTVREENGGDGPLAV